MFSSTRQSIHRLRCWLLAAATILLLVSVLEAGHAHSGLGEDEVHCALCQHSILLAALPSPTIFLIPILLSLTLAGRYIHFRSCSTYSFALIRAPPSQ